MYVPCVSVAVSSFSTVKEPALRASKREHGYVGWEPNVAASHQGYIDGSWPAHSLLVLALLD